MYWKRVLLFQENKILPAYLRNRPVVELYTKHKQRNIIFHWFFVKVTLLYLMEGMNRIQE